MSQEQWGWMVFVSAIFVGLSIGGCMSPPPSPARAFTTTDLLIDPSLLPSGWKIEAGPTEESSHSLSSLGFGNNLGGSSIDLRELACKVSTQCEQEGSSAEHIIVRFRTVQDVTRSYRDHVFTSDTVGQYAKTWKPMVNFTYQSPIADQFRVMCETIRNIPNIGAGCVIEGQYEEFLSIVLYSTLDAERALGDLEALAKAVDTRMGHYLRETGGK